MPNKWGLTGGSGTGRPIENPVGTLGIAAGVTTVTVAVLEAFNVGVDPEVVGIVVGTVFSILGLVIFRQPRPKGD